jgi:hypothetical protein
MRYAYERSSEDRMKFEDNKGKAWEAEDLDELAPWEIDELELHVAEA